MSDKPRLIISVDGDFCMGSGMCVGTAPARFALDTSGYSRPVETEIEFDPAVLDAAATCPVEAITVLNAETGKPMPLD